MLVAHASQYPLARTFDSQRPAVMVNHQLHPPNIDYSNANCTLNQGILSENGHIKKHLKTKQIHILYIYICNI